MKAEIKNLFKNRLEETRLIYQDQDGCKIIIPISTFYTLKKSWKEEELRYKHTREDLKKIFLERLGSYDSELFFSFNEDYDYLFNSKQLKRLNESRN